MKVKIIEFNTSELEKGEKAINNFLKFENKAAVSITIDHLSYIGEDGNRKSVATILYKDKF